MWIALVFVPASWLMGVTSYLTTDLTPIPLMWIIPLSLYLLSFILAFSSVSGGVGPLCQPGITLSDCAPRTGHVCRLR